jgi:hypothetical protein
VSTERIRLFVMGFQCLAVLLFTFGCTLFSNIEDSYKLEPVRRLRVKIEEGQREELFDQFEKFAEKHDFRIEITDFANMGKYFQVWMVRDNIQVVAEDVPGDPSTYDVDFLGLYPGQPVDEEAIDELLIELKSFLSEIPNVSITERP